MAGYNKNITIQKRKSNKVPNRDLLQNWLVRTAYLNSLFGVDKFDSLQKWLSDVDEGVDDAGNHTFFYTSFIGIKDIRAGKISLAKLEEYDSNICYHMKQINSNRDTPIKLKYYQWLSALYTEAYLDKYFSEGEGKLGGELENAAYSFIESKQLINSDDLWEYYVPSRNDLRKCGYWMATGSGKTFIIHLNYLQFCHYYYKYPSKIDIDRVILVTPNANLTAQHLREFKKSGISAVEFNPNMLDGYFSGNNGFTINVIETTKLIKNKTDSGKRRVDVSAFGKKNLVFVDEAHKGSSIDTEDSGWKYLRDTISKEGWTFEYSATFGQAAERKDDNGKGGVKSKTFTSFAKTILFDYSYRHFYNDGYGKDYRVLNVNEKTDEANRVLLGNLLTFYEQKLIYSNIKKIANEYNIDEPLWIFVGNTVNGKTKSELSTQSDVLTILSFFDKYLKDKTWATKTIAEFLSGNSGLIDSKTQSDLFAPEFPEQRLRYLREQQFDAETIYQNTLITVFRCISSNGLCLSRLKDTDGEIGIKCGDDFFAEIYIGDSDEFIKYVKEKNPNIYTESINHKSLFSTIDSESSTLNILIGAKKFIEGWDCYRVSCMGLLNVGKSAGTEIIQLFGRGVRLRGKNYSLKRSTYKNIPPNKDFPLLETLNIFGLNATYIKELRDYFNHEGIEKKVEKTITIRKRDDFLGERLLIPKIDKNGFSTNENIVFTLKDIEPIMLDLRSLAETEDSDSYKEGIKAQTTRNQVIIDSKYLDYLDWTKIYFSLLEYKSGKGWYNIIFTQELLENIIRDEMYILYCNKNLVTPTSFSDLERLSDIVILILKKSLQTTYTKKLNCWSYNHAILDELTSTHGNFVDYKVHINESENELITLIDDINKSINNITLDNENKCIISESLWRNMTDIEGSITSQKSLIHKNNYLITDAWCDIHLFQPLLAKIPEKFRDLITTSPEGLNDGEKEFVSSLEKYINDNNNSEYLKSHQIFLLRNLPKEGIGFYGNVWFYPDFVLWIKDLNTENQRIIFADPKGLAHISEGFENEKIKLHKEIKSLEESLNKKLESNKITLDSYIISNTPRTDLNGIFGVHSEEEYAKHHILFWKTNYIDKIISDSNK